MFESSRGHTCWSRARSGLKAHRNFGLARKLPNCWAEHPELVEELTALWLAWQAAYQDRDATLTAAADRHDRWLPGVLHRLERGPFAIDSAVKHSLRPASAYRDFGEHDEKPKAKGWGRVKAWARIPLSRHRGPMETVR
jgi:hypothetical protein